MMAIACLLKTFVVVTMFVVYVGYVAGEGTPECFEEGECTDSLILEVIHDIDSSETCLEKCQENTDCEYFTFYKEDNSCLSFANCATFSTDTCTDCCSGDRSCVDIPECFETGECLDSILLDFTYEAVDAQMCLNACQQDNNCEFFTFYEDDHSCLTFANCKAFSTDSCIDCYTGEKSCEDLQCWEEGLCNGVQIGETYDTDIDTCLEECKSNENCQWLTYDNDGGACLLFDDCPELDISCSTCLSSQKQCSQYPPSKL